VKAFDNNFNERPPDYYDEYNKGKGLISGE
jgi:hypothetical protein